MKKHIVITGGAGFVGSHLCELFLAKGFKVTCLDNFITGNRNNIAPFLSDPDFTLMEHDVSDFIELKGDVDYILHFASPASPVDYLMYPIQTLKAGALGTHNALGLAKEKKAVFLLASTSEVYGDPLMHPQKEEYWGNVNPVGPRGVYDESKRFAEAMTMAYHRFHKLDTKIARIFNTYGERMRMNDGRVIPAFITEALKGQPITVFGRGTQTRSFCYVSDLVDGIYRLLMSDLNDPVNLGNPNEMTVLELAKKIIAKTGSTSAVVFKDLPVDDPRVRQPDITRAMAKLSWKPKVPLDEGLDCTIAWFKLTV